MLTKLMAKKIIYNISQPLGVEVKPLSRQFSFGSKTQKPQLSPMIHFTDPFLGHYLSGLIEGDGYISISKEDRVILGITFNLKDKPLAEKLLSCLGKGTIIKRKTNSIELRFSQKKNFM